MSRNHIKITKIVPTRALVADKMRAGFFIAQRLYSDESGRSRSSRPAVRVALAGIVTGVAVMILTVCVVVGFKRTVTDKVACVGAHIQVTSFENNNTFEMSPVSVTDTLLGRLAELPHVASVNTFLTKPGIIKTDDSFQGIVLKATGRPELFAQQLRTGHMPETPGEVLLSVWQSRALRLDTGDVVWCYFVGEEVRVRKMRICGLYSTGFSEADRQIAWCTPEVIRRLNGWAEEQVSGIEVRLDNVRRLDETADLVWFATANHLDDSGGGLYSQTLEQLNPQIFAWLDLLDMNVVIIIILMLCVAGFNIVSGLIILILDSVSLIGVLKALGASNRFVRGIFVIESSMLVGRGMLLGNLLGFGIAALQYWTHILPLDAATYYVDFVPVAFPVGWLLLLNLGIAAVSVLVMIAPSTVAAQVSPARVMRYD